MSIRIIAEAGVNHNGDLELAKDLVHAAYEAGADMVKFQTFSAERLASSNALKSNYQLKTTSRVESQREMLKRLELSEKSHESLMSECKKVGIKFFSTAFDEKSFDFLLGLGCLEIIKVPSGELTNTPFLKHLAKSGIPILLSTGMCDLGDIEKSINCLETNGLNRDKITLLHCTTEYPTPMNEVNLRAIQTLSQTFNVEVGYSDHTNGIEVAIAASAIGATVIEKHFTMDRNFPGPDHKSSISPNELKEMVRNIRNIEVAMGDGVKRSTQSEEKNKLVVRKSLHAINDISKGDILSSLNVGTKRPGTGICASEWDDIIGKTASRSYKSGDLIEY